MFLMTVSHERTKEVKIKTEEYQPPFTAMFHS